MAALDTNVLVRWLMDDDAAQCAAVVRARKAAASAGERLLIPVTVLLELEWVLRSRYELGREQLVAVLDALLSVPELNIQAEAAVEEALTLFRRAGAPDFADCLHIGIAGHADDGPLLTFDRRAARLSGAQLLK